MVNETLERAHVVFGIITNSCLLYLIRRHTRVSLGAYKQLLTVFASYDLILTVLHGAIEPKLIIVNTTLGIASTVLEDRTPVAVLCLFYRAIYSYEHSLSLSVLGRTQCPFDPALLTRVFHPVPSIDSPRTGDHLVSILYSETRYSQYSLARITRYAIRYSSPSDPSQATIKIFRYFLCIFGLSGDVQDDATEELRFEFEKRDGMNITKGWIVMDHWVTFLFYRKSAKILKCTCIQYAYSSNKRKGWEDPRLIVILSMFDVVIICSLILALTLGTLTYSAIRRTRKISSNKKNIHLTLLIAVTAQTIVPFIFVYIPYFFCINFPYFRIPIGILAELSSFLTSCFPAWDAVIVILLFADYRTAVWSVVRRWGTVVPVKERHSMMTASLTTF
ncbi:hypothetical protein PRIPAC_84803 [Pristionchus pacificus]|uniref:G protein-coupled receptor n=1 Tax=Pristionchus pacificus TaxID=54126 RepID=A0A2A6BKG5_PRIPA|nr:hypothetical protein PRIPAC_84803 [Pristionchus pacificus]|eukprot:PDM66328.1 G protein-coupled receptor [Pristionchus pacificus]